MEYKFTDENFEEEVLKSDKPVLVDFYADWCGPCKAIAPLIAELSEEYDGEIKIGKLNVDENPNFTKEYKVMTIPNLIFFKDGKNVDRIVGAASREELVQKLNSLKK